MLIMSCYTGFFNVRRGWQSLNTGPRFYLRLIRRTGWLWIYASRTTDGHPFKPKKLSVPFLYPGVPVGLTAFRGLVTGWLIDKHQLSKLLAISLREQVTFQWWWGQLDQHPWIDKIQLKFIYRYKTWQPRLPKITILGSPSKMLGTPPISCNNVAPVPNLCLGRATMRSHSSQWSKKNVAVET